VGWRDAALLPAGLGLSLLGDAVQGGRDPLTLGDIASLTPDDVNPFDRTAARSWSPTWGNRSDRTRDALTATAVLVSFAPQVLRGRWRETATLGAIFAESALLVGGTTYVVKGLAGRERPYVHNSSLSADERFALAQSAGDDVFRSFFSGHASAAFTLAALMSTVFTDLHGRSAASDALWGASMSVAALTAFARVKAGQHYPSDVLVGAAVGTAIGTLVPALHRTGRRRAVEVAAGPGGIAVRIPLGAGR
jgi:membrane-associated phospholipid phosphatase